MADTAHGRRAFSRRTTAFAGILLTGALALTACGSDDKDDTAAVSGAAAPGSVTAAATPSGGTSPAGMSASGVPGTSGSGDGASGENPDGAAPADNPQEGGQEGTPASDDDAAQITELTKGINGDMLMADYMQYNFDHSCSAYVNARGGRDKAQVEIDGLREKNQKVSDVNAVVNITDVTDIRVTGDTATATTSGTVGDQPRTETVNYLRENGAWTICPAA